MAVQNDTEIKFSIVLYIQVIFVGQGWVYKRPTPQMQIIKIFSDRTSLVGWGK